MRDFEDLLRKEVKARYLHLPDRGKNGEWCAVIYETDGLGRDRALDVGIELSRRAIKDWIALALRNRPWEVGGTPTPDHYDRRGIAGERPKTLH